MPGAPVRSLTGEQAFQAKLCYQGRTGRRGLALSGAHLSSIRAARPPDLGHDAVEHRNRQEIAMKYRRSDAKDYARAHMKGIWAAALMPFAEDLSIDETGLPAATCGTGSTISASTACSSPASRASSSRCRSPSASARSRSSSTRSASRAGIIASCSDQNMDMVIELAKHAQAVGARVHRGARAGAALPAQAGRDALPVLQDDQRAGRHRHRDVEPSGLAAI